MTVRGVDISHYQEQPIDWHAVAHDGGIGFVNFKISEGRSNVDDTSIPRVRAAKAQGLLVGGYHLARPANPVGQDLANFQQACRGLGLDYLILDMEPAMMLGHSTPYVREWVHQFRVGLGHGNWIYTNDASLSGVLKGQAGPRWVARYSLIRPRNTWDVWQFTSSGKIAGIKDAVDVSTYRGTHAQYMALVGVTNSDEFGWVGIGDITASIGHKGVPRGRASASVFAKRRGTTWHHIHPLNLDIKQPLALKRHQRLRLRKA